MDITGTSHSFYGNSRVLLEGAIIELTARLDLMRSWWVANGERDPISYVISRVKSEDSMREKLRRRGLPVTLEAALNEINDGAGVRVVCSYINDVYRIAEQIRNLSGVTIVCEKDYIQAPKPNGYRSYHTNLVLDLDVMGTVHKVNAEIQIRTIAMDCWASLEHQLKYKHNVKNQSVIVDELRRCADEMATTDLNMQTIRDMIRAQN
ncbi:MAG: GTP pyrophosphokinase family protein [Lachnospiraceae bacterium]|nr:GTP pyrophosphokinase family protein [Lachnospiraceae bacterium]